MKDNQDHRLLYVGMGMLLLASVAAWGVVALKWVGFIWLMVIASTIAAPCFTCWLMQVLEGKRAWVKAVYAVVVLGVTWAVIQGLQMKPSFFDAFPFQNKAYNFFPMMLLVMLVVWNLAYVVVLTWLGCWNAFVASQSARK
ncbi:MAG: hypothetical protein KA221_03935 [Vitreoscilla sp.]|jgi:hypothetical protein|nr:hypothetical protein [Vitreoscilla sp.]MBP9539816.1 hypothetical protein [Vitreoscilla sp.]